MEPVMSDTIKIQLMDKDFARKSELISTTTLSYKMLKNGAFDMEDKEDQDKEEVTKNYPA